MNLGLIILAGGKSSRMGTDKAFLPWGDNSFIESTIAKAQQYGFTDIIVVTNKKVNFKHLTVTIIEDIYPQCGPLSGIHAGLTYGNSKGYFVISCDMPLLDFAVLDQLTPYFNDKVEAVIPSYQGKIQPLAAIYHKSCAKVIKTMLLYQDERRVRKLFERVVTKFVESSYFANKFFNVNTPNEFLLAKAKAVNLSRNIPILSITAAKAGTGKTTFLQMIIPELKACGLKIAVLKSDGHHFDIDHEGKDTWKFSAAGADAVAIVSPNKYAIIQKTLEKQSLQTVADKITDVDLILVESRCHGIFPIMEIMREGISNVPITAEDQLIAIITDKTNLVTDKLVLPLNEPKEVAKFIFALIKK